MVKALLVSLLLSLSVTLSAQAITMLPDHAAFVHLPDQEQKRIIYGVMEFMVAMEAEHEASRAPFKSKVKATSKELQDKIFSHIKFIQSVLISSAYAADDPFDAYRIKYLNSMKSADAQTKSDVCIYAGWISTIGTNKKCMHPSKSKISGYPNPPKVGGVKLGANDIVCNPLMFGFKDPDKATLLVAVATTYSGNSSLDCMNQSQGVNKDGKVGDEKTRIEAPEITKKRLDQLKSAYNDTSDEAKATYLRLTKLIHQTCLCPSSLKNMDPTYLNNIRPHRTCFSLLNQYKYLRKNDCSPGAETLGLNIDVLSKVVDENLTKMETKVNKFSSKELKTETDVAELKALDASFKTLLDKNTETENFCKAQAAGVQVCKIVSCSTPTTCVAKILNSQDPTKDHPVTLTKGSGTVMSIATQSTQKAPVTCSIPALSCAVGECKDGACAITIEGGSLKNDSDKSLTFGTEKLKSVDVIPTGLDANSVFPVVCAAPPKDPKCEVSKCTTDKTSEEKTCLFTVPGFATKTPKQTEFKVPKGYAEKDFGIDLEGGKSVRCETKADEVKSSCTLTIVANTDPKKVDMTLVLTMAPGETALPPAWTPAIAATVDPANANKFTATVDLESIKSKPIKVNGFAKDPEISCEEVFPKAPPKPELKLEPAPPVKNAAGKMIIVVTAIIKDGPTIDKKLLVWKYGKENDAKDVDKREIEQTPDDQEVCATHKDLNDGKEVCAKIAKLPPTQATLSLAGLNRSNQNFDVTATVTVDGKAYKDILSGGYTLVWFEKNKPELTVEEKAAQDKKAADKKAAEDKLADKEKTKKKSTGQSVDPDDTDDKKTTTTTPAAPTAKAVAGEVQNGTALTYSAPIGTAGYNICANLMKDGKIEAEGCKAVPAYNAPVQPQMGPPPVPGAYRYRRW